MALQFLVEATDGLARAGTIKMPHGDIPTPMLMVVGTQAAVKLVSIDDLKQLGVPAVLANTYHLYLKPGADVVEKLGGLGPFMGWGGPTMTDSGGFQVFSLGWGLAHGVGKVANIFPGADGGNQPRPAKPRLFRIDDDGVTFRSHLDGSQHRLTAERSIKLQQQLGADIILAFDECTSPLHDKAYTAEAMARTHAWAKRSLDAWTNRDRQALFGIVQGGNWRDLREESARFIDGLDFPGYAIGGSLGEEPGDMYPILDWTLPLLDPAKPRHLLGVGWVQNVFGAVARGIDTFDCVAPTREGRNGTVYIGPAEGGTLANKFRLNVDAGRYATDERPIAADCGCPACTNHSRAYLRHLLNVGEPLGQRLCSLHNLHFMLRLMEQLRAAILEERLAVLAKEWGCSDVLPS